MSQETLPKIALILNERDTFNHFRNILAFLSNDDFDLIIAGDQENLTKIALENDFNTLSHQQALQQNRHYAFTLSNYYILYYDLEDPHQTNKKIYLPQLLGEKHIRLMYTLGADYWNYDSWNDIYNYHLCYGPWHSQQLQIYPSEKIEIGYPRYDDFFNHCLDPNFSPEQLQQKYACKPDRQTIIWLPTRYQHTLLEFAEVYAQLSSEYNVLIKPHPLTWKEEPELIQWLDSLTLTHLIRDPIDNLYLYNLSDFIVCDYGGTAFGALYTDKKLLLFNHPLHKRFSAEKLYNYDKNHTVLEDLNQTEIMLRQSIININSNEKDQLSKIFANSQIWKEQMKQREKLRSQFFAPFYGNSAEQAASFLTDLLIDYKKHKDRPSSQ